MKNRTLGSGFGPGNEFILFKDEPYRGLINSIDQNQMVKVAKWIESGNSDITTVLDQHTVAKVMPDVLVDLEVTHLIKILPGIMAALPSSVLALFSNESTLAQLDARFLQSLTKSLPEGMPTTVNAATLAAMLSSDNIVQVKPEILAYLVPAILDLMDDVALIAAANAIAKLLAPKDFKALADEKYFNVDIHDAQDDEVTLQNNQRTISFRAAKDTNSHAFFRGKKWTLDHTHLHLEGAGEEREYKLYESRAQYADVLAGKVTDPNHKIVGEIHNVFRRAKKKDANTYKYSAVGIPLVIGEKNADFEILLEKVSDLDSLSEDKKIEGVHESYKKLFMPTFEASQNKNSLFYHSWSSLKSNTPGFRAGLRFVIAPDPIVISQEQYDRFKKLFGEMAPLSEEKVLEPIERKANHRQQRMF